MSLHRIPPRRTGVMWAGAIARRLTSVGAAVAFLLVVACGDSSGPGGGGAGATLSGTVRDAGALAGLEDVTIMIGTRQATSDASGHFELTGLPVGTATVRAERPGYLPEAATVTLRAGANTHNFALTVQEIFVSGANAVYVPAGVGPLRGTIIILGGPITSGFVTGDRIAPVGNDALEQSLQGLGASLRALATTTRMALFGTSTIALANSAGSDNVLFAAIGSFAGLSGHPEIATAPVLLFGLSAGAPEASGLVARHPDRAIGLLVRVPTGVTNLLVPAALAVPTFVMQAELDDVNNLRVEPTYVANRSRGGLWALAVEPGIGHSVATHQGNLAVTDWITAALTLRLPAAQGDPLVALDESSGWLGNQTTLEIAPWANYVGDRTMASWLLSQSAATSWQKLGTPSGG